MPRHQYLFQTPDFEQSIITPRLKVNLGQSVRVQGRYDWMQSVGNPLSEWKEGMIECQKIWLNAQQLLRAPFPPNPSVTPFPSCYHFAISSFEKYKIYMKQIHCSPVCRPKTLHFSQFGQHWYILTSIYLIRSPLDLLSTYGRFKQIYLDVLYLAHSDLIWWISGSGRRIYPSLSRWQLLPSPLSISWLQISQNPPGWIVYLQRNLKNHKKNPKKS